MDITRRQITAGLLALPLLTLPMLALPLRAAWADSVGDAKAKGQVGERPDGYLGVVGSSAPASVVAMVQQINNERRARYQAIAQKNNITLNAVEVVAGAKLTQDAAPGSFVMDKSGQWQKK